VLGESHQLGFCIIKNYVRSWAKQFYDFLNMEWAQNATIRSSIGAPEIVVHDVRHTRIILKLAKFYPYVD